MLYIMVVLIYNNASILSWINTFSTLMLQAEGLCGY